MAFWSSERIIDYAAKNKLVDPFDKARVTNCSYSLSLGPEAFVTSQSATPKEKIDKDSHLSIPPGQFALLLTEETITIPDDTIGFISIRASIKFRGLVNVSGFHVDPGFSGRLKFSVYNAGSRDIVLARGEEAFLLWLSCLDQPTKDLYHGTHQGQTNITTDDVMRIQGEVASPAALSQRIDVLSNKVRFNTWMIGTVITTAVLALLVGLIINSLAARGTRKNGVSQGMAVEHPVELPDIYDGVPEGTVGRSNAQQRKTTGRQDERSGSTELTPPKSSKEVNDTSGTSNE